MRKSPGVIWSDGRSWLFDLGSVSGSGIEPSADKGQCGVGRSATTEPLADSAFKARISVARPSGGLTAGSAMTLRVEVNNLSNVSRPALGATDGSYQINLGNHWLDRQGRTVVRDDVRVALPRDLGPHEEVELLLTVTAPKEPGGYLLELDMVQERVAWFKQRGSQTAVTVVDR